MSDWQPIETAPRDGSTLCLQGTWPNSEDTVEIQGLYEEGGFTEGWVDAERFNVFYPTHWKLVTDVTQ